jgi:anti-sigma B factor antagonist
VNPAENSGAASGLSVEVREDAPGDWHIAVSGEIDLSSVPRLEAALAEAMTRSPRSVCFDLRQVTFMDSSGLAFLIGVGRRVESVRIEDASPAVRHLVELSGLAGPLGLSG